jgi:hypothetical protein
VPSRGSEQTPMRASSASRASDLITSWSAFRSEVERSIGLLQHIRLQVSLFAVRLGGGCDGATVGAVAGTLARLGTVGWLADGRIGLLYMGPRATGQAGDVGLMQHVRTMIERRLAERGFSVPGDWLELSATHAWTDEISGIDELSRPLFERRERRGSALIAPFARFAH